MPSAACYTNKRRVIAEASITKVQYPRQIAVQNTLLSTENCPRNFLSLNYVHNIPCNTHCLSPAIGGILDGGYTSTQSLIILDGGNHAIEPSTILDGNS